MSQEKTKRSHADKQGRLSFLDQVVFSESAVDCENFEERVNDVLDQRKLPQEDIRLTEHADQCTKCQLIMHEYVSVNDSLKLLKDDIAALMDAGENASKTPHGSRKWKFFAILAAVLIMLSSAWWLELHISAEQQTASRSIASRAQFEFVPSPFSEEQNSDLTKVSELATSNLFGLPYPNFDVQFPPLNHVVFDVPINQLTSQWEQLDPAGWYPGDLPVMVPGTVAPVNMTIEFIKTFSRPTNGSSAKRSPIDPDLGAMLQSPYIAMI